MRFIASIKCMKFTNLARHLRKLSVCAASTLLVLVPLTSSGALLNLDDKPLVIADQVKPNTILAIDDSGSMDFEVLFEANDGALWYSTTQNTFTGWDNLGVYTSTSGVINFNIAGKANGSWKKYSYLFPNGINGTYNGMRVYGDSNNNHYAIPPTKELAFARSPDFNKAYYDPDVVYEPWVSFGATTFGNVDKTNAPWDPVYSGAGTVDLTQDIVQSNTGWNFKFFNGMVEPDGTITSGIDENTSGCNDGCMQIGYFPATYYRIAGTPDNTGYNLSQVVLEGLAPDGSTLEKYEIKLINYTGAPAYNAAMQNFANWFTYYRRRHLAMRAGMGAAFEGLIDMYTGIFTINKRVAVTMWDMATQANTFYTTLYNSVGSGGTPNRQALDWAGQQYERIDANAPIIEACQQNYTIQFTDGFSTTNTGSGVNNADGPATAPLPPPDPYSGTAPYADNFGNTLADIAMHYYKNNLRTDLTAGQVPTSPEDPNPDPHMVTFTVGLGAKGWIYGVTHNTIDDAYTTPPVWQDPNGARDPVQIDELYHAAINGRGDMLNASTPERLSAVMKETLQNIISRTGSKASVALNSGSLSANTRIYQAKFKSGAWTGQLLSYGLNLSDGSVIVPELWDAATLLDARIDVDSDSDTYNEGWDTNRKVITFDGTSGVPFRWGSLTAAMKTELDKDGQGVPDTPGSGQDRLEYLRGSNEHEDRGKNYRFRASNLGDIVNSSPVFVGNPVFGYADTLEASGEKYSTFKANKTGRTQVIYAGANDGMLHGFNAGTGVNAGEEVIAYVPNAVFPNLTRLTPVSYDHRFFADGAPTVGDAFDGSAWHTVLVAGLNKGGQAIYALDVTNPASFSEASAGSIAMWEYTDDDLGYSFSQPAIVRMANDQWAAVFGNGYNNSEADGSASTFGRAYLYIVDLFSGTLIQKIDTGAGSAATPNGLATVAPVDVDGDRTVDYVYAGDLLGNLWKFDVTDTNPSNWGKAFGGNALFVAKDDFNVPQPITVRPDIALHPSLGGYMVYFGTGRYLEDTDNSNTLQQTQTFYGIWDPDGASAPGAARSDLLEQEILEEKIFNINGTDAAFRDITKNPIVWQTTPGVPATGDHLGWYLDLVNTGASPFDTKNGDNFGERNVTNPVFRLHVKPDNTKVHRIIFTTFIPSSSPCDFGGDGWLMELDATHGGRLPDADPPFDVDGDGVFESVDFGSGGGNQSPGGVKDPTKDPGGLSEPGILTSDDGTEYKYIGGTNEAKIMVIHEQGGAGGAPAGTRESWQQIR